MAGDKKKNPERVPTEKGTMETDKLKINEKLYFDVKREGVFVHSFVCNSCGLHFNVFSWQENRHGADNVYCPECGKREGFRHFKLVLSDNPEMQLNSKREIFNFCPLPGSQFMDDSKY